MSDKAGLLYSVSDSSGYLGLPGSLLPTAEGLASFPQASRQA
jgi:hypothetical protein